MRMTLEEFRDEATRLRAARKRGAPRCSKEMQRWAVAYAKRAGVNISRAAKQLGMSDMTLRSWVRVADAGGAFVPVTVSEEGSASTAATAYAIRFADAADPCRHRVSPVGTASRSSNRNAWARWS